ncbi:MAG: chain length-determining protein [Burkholderiales bacterium]|nr:chain length-determining protein [Burkholderiales bacterium]
MTEILRQVRAILRAMWRHRRLGMAASWVVGVIAAVFVMLKPDTYEASARIYVDTQSILQPLMSGLAVQPNVEQQVMMLSRTLLSRPNMEKLVRMADLDLGVKSRAAQDQLIDGLIGEIKIRTTTRDNLYTLSYRDTNPDRAKRVVQSLTSIFVESSLGDKRKDSDTAKKFIDDQIRGYEKKLEEAEVRLKDFKLRNIETQINDGKSGIDRFSDISAQLANARLALREAENSRDALKRQIAGEDMVMLPDNSGGVASDSGPAVVAETDGRIDALRRNLDQLLQRYTEQHPDVSGTRRMIRELEEQRKQELAARKKVVVAPSGQPISINTNPVFQQLKVALGEAEANVASLKARVAEFEGRFARVKDSMKVMPQLEAELAQLNRDYDVNKKNYEGLVARRESASLTGELGSASGVADFRLIDPPRVAPQPVAPNRMLLLAAALGISLGAGIFASFAAVQVRPVFHDGRMLREVTGLPLLGVVGLNLTEADRRKERRSLLRFLVALLLLVGLYAGGIAFLYVLEMRAAG